jgi:hypothetical protein
VVEDDSPIIPFHREIDPWLYGKRSERRFIAQQDPLNIEEYNAA